MCGVKTVRNEHVYQKKQSKHGTSFNQYNKRSAHDKKNIENALEATVYDNLTLRNENKYKTSSFCLYIPRGILLRVSNSCVKKPSFVRFFDT